MKAAVFHAARDIRIENVAAPTCVGSHDVLLKPKWCGICGTDLHEYVAGPIVIPTEPHALTGAKAPQILGHEFSAEVIEIGNEVKALRRGDRVSIQPLVFCGRCYYCRRGMNHLCTVMGCVGLSWQWGGIADLAVVDAAQANLLPDTVSDVQGALVEPAAVALYAVDRGGVAPGASVLVAGGGPIGALVALACHAAGASQIFVSEPNRARRARVAELGVASAVLDPKTDDVVQRTRDATGGVGVDVAIECAGIAQALNTCVDAVRPAGAVVQAALHVDRASVEPMKWALKDLRIEGTWCYPVTTWPRVISLIGSGRLPVEKIVHSQIGIDDVVKRGFDVLTDPSGDKLKVLVGAG